MVAIKGKLWYYSTSSFLLFSCKCWGNECSRLFEKRKTMETKKKFIVNCLFYGLILFIVVVLAKYVMPIMTPFIIAFCVSGLMEFLTKRMGFKREKLRRLLSLGLCGVLYAVAFTLVALVSAKIVSEAVDLITAIPSFFTNYLMPLINRGADYLETVIKPYDVHLAAMVDELSASMIKTIGQFVTDFSGKALVWVTNSATSIPGVIVQVIITVISTFFMVLDFDKVFGFLKKLVPVKMRDVVSTGAHYAKTMVLVYIKSYSILFTLTFVELTIGFLILGVQYAPVLALAIAVFDLLPILGTGGILLPWTLIALIIGNYKMSIGILVLYLIITAIRNTLEPKIVGKQIGLHPLATLISMLLGLNLFGLVGLLGVPVLVAVLNAMYRAREVQSAKQENASAEA